MGTGFIPVLGQPHAYRTGRQGLSLHQQPENVSDKSAIMAKVAKLQIPFIENQGQVKDKRVKFYANTFAGNVYVTEKGEIVYGLVKAEGKGHGAMDNRQKVAAELCSASFLKSRNRSSDLLIEKNNTPKGVFLQQSTSHERRNTASPSPPTTQTTLLSLTRFLPLPSSEEVMMTTVPPSPLTPQAMSL